MKVGELEPAAVRAIVQVGVLSPWLALPLLAKFSHVTVIEPQATLATAVWACADAARTANSNIERTTTFRNIDWRS